MDQLDPAQGLPPLPLHHAQHQQDPGGGPLPLTHRQHTWVSCMRFRSFTAQTLLTLRQQGLGQQETQCAPR
jgi:hypothetical protein